MKNGSLSFEKRQAGIAFREFVECHLVHLVKFVIYDELVENAEYDIARFPATRTDVFRGDECQPVIAGLWEMRLEVFNGSAFHLNQHPVFAGRTPDVVDEFGGFGVGLFNAEL